MSSTARNRSANAAMAIPVHVWGEQESSECGYSREMISEAGTVRFAGNNGVADTTLRRKLDTLDREFAKIFARLDGMKASHQNLAASEHAGH
jgi:glutaredoxin-related protein